MGYRRLAALMAGRRNTPYRLVESAYSPLRSVVTGGFGLSLGLRTTSVSCPRTLIVRAASDLNAPFGPSSWRGRPPVVRRRRQLLSSFESLDASRSLFCSSSRPVSSSRSGSSVISCALIWFLFCFLSLLDWVLRSCFDAI